MYSETSLYHKLLCGLGSIFSLVTRFYLASVFLKAGVQKITNWESSTLFLFEYEYKVPILSPHLAAIMATSAELILPIFLLLGVFTRPAAAILFVFNAMAVYSYQHVLLKGGISLVLYEGWLPYGISFPGGFEDHFVWGLLALALIAYGGGKIAVDTLLFGKRKRNTGF